MKRNVVDYLFKRSCRGLTLVRGTIFVLLGALFLSASSFAQDAGSFTYASRMNQSIVNLADVNCLLVEPDKLRYARKTYDPREVMKIVEEVLSVAPILMTQAPSACKWELAVTIVTGENFGVQNNGRDAKYLISPNICEWDSAKQQLNPNRCLAKTIYVFYGGLEPADLFRLGLFALKQPQTEKLQTFEHGRSL